MLRNALSAYYILPTSYFFSHLLLFPSSPFLIFSLLFLLTYSTTQLSSTYFFSPFHLFSSSLHLSVAPSPPLFVSSSPLLLFSSSPLLLFSSSHLIPAFHIDIFQDGTSYYLLHTTYFLLLFSSSPLLLFSVSPHYHITSSPHYRITSLLLHQSNNIILFFYLNRNFICFH